jgi:hypothetical protein
VSEAILYRWVAQDQINRGERPGLASTERSYLDFVEGHREPRSGKVREWPLGHLGREERVRPHLLAPDHWATAITESPWLNPLEMPPDAARDFGGI